MKIKSETHTSKFFKSKTSIRFIMSCNRPGVPINMFAPSSSIFFMSAFTSAPPTRSMDLTFTNVEMNGCATLYIWVESSLVGDIIIPSTYKNVHIIMMI